MKTEKPTNRIFFVAIMLSVVIIMLVGIVLTPKESLSLKGSPIDGLNDDWTFFYDDASTQVDLPVKFPEVVANDTYTITKVLPDTFPEDMYLRVRLSMQYMTVSVDGQKIYEYHPTPSKGFQPPEASVWKFVPLAGKYAGRTLRIDFTCPVEAFAGSVNDIYFGARGALVSDIVHSNFLGILIAVALLLISFIALLGAFIIKFHQDLRLLILSLFSMTMGIWLLSEMALLQFLTGSRFIIGGISYILLPIMPILFAEYLRYVILDRYKRIIIIHNAIYFTLLVVNFFLQSLGLVYFIDSIVVVDGMLLLSAAMIVALLIHEHRKYQNQNAKKMLRYMGILVVMVFVEVILFFSRNYLATSAYSRIGFMIFFILLAVDAMRQLNKLINLEKERQYYEELAYTDILTKAKNRAAYERDLDLFEADASIQSIAVILMDLNHLKHINDRFGHKSGDHAIRLCIKEIEHHFSEIGTYYRIGGDEFTCIITNPSEQPYLERIESLRDSVAAISMTLPYPLEMAIGSGEFSFDDDRTFSSYDAFFHYVDTRMYEDKKRLKQQ